MAAFGEEIEVMIREVLCVMGENCLQRKYFKPILKSDLKLFHGNLVKADYIGIVVSIICNQNSKDEITSLI